MKNEAAGFTYEYIDKGGSRTLLLLHGTGGDERDLIPIGQTLDPKANLLSPRGQINEQGMPRFFKRIAEGIFDYADLSYRSAQLADFILEASNIHGFPSNTIVAVGYSNGANIALYLLASQPSILQGAILFRPMSTALPRSIADISTKHIFIASGAADQLIPYQDTEQLIKLVKDSGAVVSTHTSSHGHSLTKEDIDHARTWLLTLNTQNPS